jgi:hypothetical protein
MKNEYFHYILLYFTYLYFEILYHNLCDVTKSDPTSPPLTVICYIHYSFPKDKKLYV